MQTQDVNVIAGPVNLPGFLTIPDKSKGIVLFAHGSGSSRHSPRNQSVAKLLNKRGLATLLIDLLTPEEESEDMLTRKIRFDIPFLAIRLVQTTEWLLNQSLPQKLNVGYFGSSTGAAAALIAAAQLGSSISAVVSRGGRPDLAMDVLDQVRAATLFIVGGDDFGVIELNQQAFENLNCKKEFSIVEGATHLFSEPGKLEEVAQLAGNWFQNELV